MTIATYSEACREYARNCGDEDGREELAWIMTPWDTWEANPHYNGPPVRHPEYEDHEEDPDAPPLDCEDIPW